jgi:hypothetical protein
VITIFFLWLFLPFILVGLALLGGFLLLRWLGRVLDRALEEDEK